MESSLLSSEEFINFNTNSHMRAKPPRMAYFYFPKFEEQLVKEGDEYSRKIFSGMVQYTEAETQILREFEYEICEYNKNCPPEEKINLPHNWKIEDTLRILQGNGNDHKKSIKCLKDHLKWKSEMFPIKISNNIIEILNSGFIYVHGRDNRYRTLLIIRPHIFSNLHTKYVIDDWITSLAFLMSYVIKQCLIPGQVESWVIICDASESSVVFMPKDLKLLLNAMADNFRCRLYSMYLINVSFFLKMAWSVIKSMLHPSTQKKIQVMSKNDFSLYYKNVIHPSQLEKKFGGQAENVENQFFPPIFPSDLYMTDNEEIHVSEDIYNQIIRENKNVVISPYHILKNQNRDNESDGNRLATKSSVYEDCKCEELLTFKTIYEDCKGEMENREKDISGNLITINDVQYCGTYTDNKSSMVIDKNDNLVFNALNQKKGRSIRTNDNTFSFVADKSYASNQPIKKKKNSKKNIYENDENEEYFNEIPQNNTPETMFEMEERTSCCGGFGKNNKCLLF